MPFRVTLAAALAAALTIMAAAASAAQAEDLHATPADLNDVFHSAHPGDRILLASGDYGTFAGALEAGPARVTLTPEPGATPSMAINFHPASNITLDGLSITDAYIAGSQTHDVTVKNSTFNRSQAVIDTGELARAAIVFDHNLHVGFDKCDVCAEGRVQIQSRNSSPSGVTIENSVFAGGNSDGIQDGGNGVQILNNEFAYIKQLDQHPEGVHADAVQLSDSTNTVINHNYFHDDADAIMAADGANREAIENNVIGRTDNPTAITLYSDDSSVVRHNTISDVGCTNDANCGVLAVGNKDGDPPGQNTTVMDNIVGDVSASEGTATFAYLGFNFNMIGYGELLAGSSNFAGAPTFAGGDRLATVNDFALAPLSPGRSSASDGKDVGANGFPWTWAPGPVVAGAKSPTIASHADLKFDATSPDGRVVSYTQPAALDGNGHPLKPDCWPHPGATFPLDDPEPMTVTCIATATGKIAVTQFHVSIVDTTPPQITVPGDLTREATGSAGAVVTYPNPTAHDLVDGDIEPTCDRQPGAVFPFGRTTVTCTAADAHHHVASKQFVVTVEDTTPPALHGLPADMRVTAAPGATGTVVRYTLPTATDVVDGGRPVACAPASGALFAVGATVVTCRAGDKAGNTAAGRFTVTVGQLPSGAAAIASARAKGAGVTVGLYCPAGTSGCTAVKVRLAVSARLKHGKVVRLGASGHRTIVVGASAPRTIAAGQTVKLRVKLNRTGRALLKRFHRMKVTVRVSTGRSAAATRGITLKAPKRGH